MLFVSQKMAALDVVRGNMEKCGLGDRCLELHDPKRNRADIVKDIAASLEEAEQTAIRRERRPGAGRDQTGAVRIRSGFARPPRSIA